MFAPRKDLAGEKSVMVARECKWRSESWNKPAGWGRGGGGCSPDDTAGVRW